MGKKQNHHYVSQFLTRDWETDSVARELIYFDFSTRSFGRGHAKRLFAAKNLHSVELERRLEATIETPLGRLVTAHKAGEDTKPLMVDANVLRAIRIVMLIQVGRILETRQDPEEALAFALNLADDQLDQVAWLMRETRRFVLITLPATQRLRYPEVGMFPFPCPDLRVRLNVGLALPVAHDAVIASIATTSATDALSQSLSTSGLLPCASAGTSGSFGRTVVHPDEYSELGEEECRARLNEHRKLNDSTFDLLAEAFNLFRRIDDLTGVRFFGSAIDPFRCPPASVLEALERGRNDR